MQSRFDTSRFAVILNHDRREMLTRLVSQLSGSCDILLVLDNASEVPVDPNVLVKEAGFDAHIVVHRDEEQPPNLSRLWNVGFDICKSIAEANSMETWDVAMFNDDTSLPANWYNAVAHALRNGPEPVVVACGQQFHGRAGNPLVKRAPDNDLMTRMTPHAFVTKGEVGLRSDETIKWWWSDTDFDWRARQVGGLVIIPDYVAENTDANGYTNRNPLLGQQAGLDRETFRLKWGYNPW